jgi:hypothetical protein
MLRHAAAAPDIALAAGRDQCITLGDWKTSPAIFYWTFSNLTRSSDRGRFHFHKRRNHRGLSLIWINRRITFPGKVPVAVPRYGE